MKKLTPFLVAFLAVAPFAFPSASTFAQAPAAPTPGAPIAPAASNNSHGKVTAVDTTANSITIDSKKNGSHTYTTDSSTVVKIDGVAGQLSGVQVGMNAAIKSTDGKIATEINARTHAKHGKGAPAAPAAQ